MEDYLQIKTTFNRLLKSQDFSFILIRQLERWLFQIMCICDEEDIRANFERKRQFKTALHLNA